MVIVHAGIALFLAGLISSIYYTVHKRARSLELLFVGELAFMLSFAACVFLFEVF